jgi:hypothetical protein
MQQIIPMMISCMVILSPAAAATVDPKHATTRPSQHQPLLPLF